MYSPECRICHKKINKLLELEGDDWVMPSKNHYFHTSCYEDWAKKNDEIHANGSDDEWFEFLKYYLNHVIKANIDYKKLTSQWKHFTNQKTKTAKGVYFAVKYFYEIQKGNKEKAQGGIGIVSAIYDDSCQYWRDREEREAGICARIEEQIRMLAKQKWVRVPVQEEVDRQKAAKQNLANALAALEDDEE